MGHSLTHLQMPWASLDVIQ